MRIRSSKPNHSGSYSQQRKLHKARNHSHIIKRFDSRNKSYNFCTVPKCLWHELI